ncbi:hypothetical protein [Hymenobacter volaticus]|uniref:Uncharacterized protein n=1 Tax=Hymenobacter volaticus TaxID=2932254 RepID=A0ABY4G1A1_9BACT|nr:hypothetical protein [Hymenobacter volaticus]UOQ64611.1 hypothetical protein MUN86_13595 [Hymenobacter volaticus]
MKEYFRFNSGIHNFWPLYETIKAYYPLGILESESDAITLHETYPGYQQIASIIEDNLFDAKNYQERWGSFNKFLRKKFKRKISGSINTFSPCFSGCLTLEESDTPTYLVAKEIHFVISLLGPYYTLYGVDSSTLMLALDHKRANSLGIDQARYPTIHAITVSPHLEYEAAFLQLKHKIVEWFPNYKFVPYAIHQMRLRGLSTNSVNPKGKNQIFCALFKPDLAPNLPTRGDKWYGFAEWPQEKVPTSEDERNQQLQAAQEEKNRQLLEAHIQRQSAGSVLEVSIHKVWKFKTAKQLPGEGHGIGMMSLEMFDTLDLIDPNELLYTTQEAGPVKSSLYSIVGNVLSIHSWDVHLGSYFRFLVTDLSASQLRLILHLDFVKGRKILKGNIVELLLELQE